MQSDIKALVFDVFGTCVDSRGSIGKECRVLGKTKGLRVNRITAGTRAPISPTISTIGLRS